MFCFLLTGTAWVYTVQVVKYGSACLAALVSRGSNDSSSNSSSVKALAAEGGVTALLDAMELAQSDEAVQAAGLCVTVFSETVIM
jgi:hypothetical protein